ncbi:MAG: adaptor protein MecA [Acutalibacteraceae bacterium]
MYIKIYNGKEAFKAEMAGAHRKNQMEFEKSGDNCIFAQVSRDELLQLGLTYEDLDYAEEKTRLALKYILSKAQYAVHDKHSFKSKIRIDVMPCVSDGCVIIFTDLSSASKEKQDETPTAVFQCESYDSLADCSKVLSSLKLKAEQSSLYKDYDGYCLIVRAQEKILRIIGEYTDKIFADDTTTERIGEFMQCIIENDALEILCGSGTKS